QTFFGPPPTSDDGRFVAGFSSPFPPPFFVTATATAAESPIDRHGSTSEFSACVQPDVAISDALVDFGSLVVGTGTSRTVTFTNTGANPLSGIVVGVVGPNAGDFSAPGACQ